MSRISPSPAQPAPNGAGWSESLLGRKQLARLVVVGSFGTIFLLVAALLIIAEEGSAAAAATADKAFTTVLPVLAGWVGTVLAFYFSAASQERTSNSLDQAIKNTGGSTQTGTGVSEKMIPMSGILGLQKLDVTAPKDLPLSGLQALFAGDKDKGVNGISRIVFVDKNVFQYVLHIGTLNAFLISKTNQDKTASSGALTFADLLTDSETLRQISTLVVFVSASALLADAKTALDGVAGAQDIIVTATGNASGPMLGWLTNVDLTKALTAS